MDVGKKEKRLQNPRANANIFEIFTFSWILNLFKLGRKRELEENDLYLTLDEHASSLLGNDLEKRWRDELTNAKNTGQQPSLLTVLFKMIGAKFMFFGLIQTFVELVLRTSQPLLIGALLTYFDPDGSDPDSTRAYVCASGLVLNMLANIVLFHYSQMESMHCGMKIRVACCSAIYKKALRLSKTSVDETTVGQIVNLLSNDVNRFDIALKYAHFLWIGPMLTVVVTYFLWREIGGVSSLLGVAALLTFVPLQGWLGKKTSEFRLKIAPRTDERVRLMNEIISGIQVIKMYTWEKPFALLVRHARKTEIGQIRNALYIRVIMESFKIFHTRFALFLSILSYVVLGNNIGAKKVYVVIAYYNILRTTMTVFFPQGISLVAEMFISIKRIQDFLLRGEKDELENRSTDGVRAETADDRTGQDDTERSPNGIAVSNVTAKWTDVQTENTLENINLTVRPGRLVAIIGPVGAGKSSLLQAILRELPVTGGDVSVRGVVSYASQDPWLFDSSVRQNILFGSPMDAERYERVVNACALNPDLARFPHGDGTAVGERGVAVSGGQRARIHLARAVYKTADVYLLDDPLSAVDARVGRHLFDQCITGHLKGKTRVLITHQTQYLTDADDVVLMERANVSARGSYRELQSSGLDFAESLRPPPEGSTDKRDNGPIASSPVTASRPSSVRSVSSSSSSSPADESRPNGTRPEPARVAETRTSGNVTNDVYFSYFTAGGKAYKSLFFVSICVFTQILCTGEDCWINYWINLEDGVFRHHGGDRTAAEDTSSWPRWPITRGTCVAVYSVVNVAVVVAIFVRCAASVSFFTSASTSLHDNMFDAVTRAKMYFFHTNPSGRILNRFAKDMGAVDETLPAPVLDFVYVLLSSVGVMLVIGSVNAYFILPTIIAAVLFYHITVVYLSTSRSVKRLEGVTKSPVFGHLNASLQGLTTIRAFGAEETLSAEFDRHQDLHSSAWYLFISSSEAFGLTLDMVCLVYIGVLTFGLLAVCGDNDALGGNIGLVITQAINLTGSAQWGIRQTAELVNNMTSVERVLEYTNVPQEAALESPPDKKPPKEWPDKGEIVFEEFYLRYCPNTPHVLKNLNIRIRPTEKIGIVGRTGAGKSSLIAALFRLAFNEGRISVDGVEIHGLGLHELRSKISIIPQEPVLFSGTMRTNLDPFDEYSDHVLWNALHEVELKTVVEDLAGGLNAKMSAGGSNFSVGQRQLVCLARAIVRSNRLIVLDEATANVDSQTDALIQNTVRNKFRACTVLTIAHRLNTVMDSDRVLVMDAGEAVEFDHPFALLANKDGFLYNMVENTERDTADSLRDVAAASYYRTTVPHTG